MTQTKTAYGMLYVGGYSGTISAYYLSQRKLYAWRYEVIPPGTAGDNQIQPRHDDIYSQTANSTLDATNTQQKHHSKQAT